MEMIDRAPAIVLAAITGLLQKLVQNISQTAIFAAVGDVATSRSLI
jgi:type III secretory pathway component EscS